MANKYKIQAKGGEHVVITLASDDSVVGVREFSTRELSAVAEGGAVNLIAAPADTKVFIGLDHTAIYKSDGTTLWGSDLSTTVTNLNAFFLTSPHKLEDLDDIPAPVNNRFLKYSSDTYSWEEASGGSSAIQTAINITNSDAAFSHMTTPITVGTNIEAVLRDMLEKYNVTSISLTNVSRALQNTTSGGSGYGSFNNVSSGATLEVGQGLRIQGFNYNITDNTQTADTSVVFLEGSSTIESGFADDNAAKTLASVLERDLTVQSTKSYKVQATDTGGGSNVTITSGTISFNWYYRVRVGSSTTAAIADNAAAQTLWGTLTAPFDNLIAQGDFTATADAGMDAANKFTWIAYPSAWGAPNQILLNNSTDVLSDFEAVVERDITNDYGVTTTYRFYRSTFDDAFASGQTIKIDF